MSSVIESLKIYKKWEDAAVDAYRLLKKFPKEERFVLASQIREAVLEAGTLILSINEDFSGPSKCLKADKLDLILKRIRALFDLSLRFAYITPKNDAVICDKWIEIGKMLGGWRKSFR